MDDIKPGLERKCLWFELSPRSFRYRRLQEHFKFSVIRLNGSSFEVEVVLKATVRDLKQAVENVFANSTEEDQIDISWSHVWSYFFLCYEGQKLVDDNVYVRSFGIKDGDQLYFVRRSTVESNPPDAIAEEENAAYGVLFTSIRNL
ncbi:hypothetical protein K2173_017876 [Erythroxylum novogranatense]|uniref:Ubiquitin-like domain-containing protein n=1 Tax=Erythroxylum novogranatense TaxID=1862640 RepID=A0AAV8SMV2_9ROSI|nr:hypothetical protein K2173_017876 [Erythroxylum novogranatense]